jgi:hypothetical protein
MDMMNLIDSVEIRIGNEVVTKNKVCRKCHKCYPVCDDPEYDKLVRQMSYQKGDLSVCVLCDEHIENYEQKMLEDQKNYEESVAKRRRDRVERNERVSLLEMRALQIEMKCRDVTDFFEIDMVLDSLTDLADEFDGVHSDELSVDKENQTCLFERQFHIKHIDTVKSKILKLNEFLSDCEITNVTYKGT